MNTHFSAEDEEIRREIADWLGLDVGHLTVGSRADVVVLNPEMLDERMEEIHEVPMSGFEGMHRLVRRNDDAVDTVLIGGRVAWRHGRLTEGLGAERGFGQVLRAGTERAAVPL